MKYSWNVIGHKQTIRFLEKLLDVSNRPHGYLFYGGKGLGKDSLVQQFIRQLMCQNYHIKNDSIPECIPCGSCEHCQQKQHPDICIIDREVDEKTGKLKKNISIEQIRVLQGQLQKGTFLGAYNCGLIQNAHLLSDSAANSLLKLLEEPPKQTLLFLTADTLVSIPKTIMSRCQLVHIGQVATEAIKVALENNGIESEKAQRIAQVAQGAPQYALSLAQNTEKQEAYYKKIQEILQILQAPNYERFQIIDASLKEYKGVSAQLRYVSEFVSLLNSVLRDILLISYGVSSEFRVHMIVQQDLEKLTQKYSSERIKGLLIQNKRFLQQVNKNINPQLALENILLSL